jgi:hypothetical protein
MVWVYEMTIRWIRKHIKAAENEDELDVARRLAKKIRRLRLMPTEE